MLAKYLKSLDLLKAFQNFPMSSVLAIVSTVCAIILMDYQDSETLPKVVAAGYLAFLSAISVEIYRKLSGKIWVLIIPILVFIVWYLYLPLNFDNVPKYQETQYAYRFIGMGLILHLIISFIPYIRPSAEEDFWEYNKHLFLRIFESVLFSLIIFIGLSLAILAIDKLFGIDVDGEWYGRLYLFLIGIFNSLYFLSKFPEIDYNGTTEKPVSAFKVFSQYILIGISTIYLILLYAYAAKIILEGALPQGWIGYLTLCFSIVGILTWLLNYFNPKFSDNRFTNFYIKHFFKFLTVPVMMLIIAIYVRLNEYGITENRYIVAILAAWLLFVTLDFGWLKKVHIKYIPISFAVLTVFAVFSPLNMFSLSERNQTSRLLHFMEENEILNKRKFDIEAIASMDNTRKYELKRKIIDLGNRSDLKVMDDWVDESLFENYFDSTNYNRANFLNKKFRIITAQTNKRTDDIYFNLNTKRDDKIDVKGFSTMTFCRISKGQGTSEKVITVINGDELELEGFSNRSLKSLILSHSDNNGRDLSQSEMTIIFKNESDSTKLLIEYLHGNIRQGKIKVEGGQGWLLESGK